MTLESDKDLIKWNMGLFGFGKNCVTAQEGITQTILTSIFPGAQVEREALDLKGTDGRHALLDFVVYLPGGLVAVLLEVTDMSIDYHGEECNKSKQMRIAWEFIAQNPQFAALFLFGECFVNPVVLCQSLQYVPKLAYGRTDSNNAQSQINSIAHSQRLASNLVFDWDALVEEVPAQYHNLVGAAF